MKKFFLTKWPHAMAIGLVFLMATLLLQAVGKMGAAQEARESIEFETMECFEIATPATKDAPVQIGCSVWGGSKCAVPVMENRKITKYVTLCSKESWR